MSRQHIAFRIQLAILLALASEICNAAIVYDSITEPVNTGGFGFLSSIEIGQSITLQGGARTVRRIDLALGANTPALFRVRFYDLDAAGIPTSAFWESQLQKHPSIGGFDRVVIAVNVPDVTVPNSFAWIVAPLAPESSGMLVSSSDPPTIGTSLKAWRRGADLQWKSAAVNSGVFGARVTAVPEPAPGHIAVAALAMVAIFPSRRLRRPRGGEHY